MSRRRRQSPPPPPVAWPDLSLPGLDSKSKPEPESSSAAVSRLGYCEFHRICNRLLDALDAKTPGELYTPAEIERKNRARAILREELDRIIGRRDSVSARDIESANQICPGVVLRFDAKRTARNGNRS